MTDRLFSPELEVERVDSTTKHEQHRPANGADCKMLTKHRPRTGSGHILEEGGKTKAKRKIKEVGEDIQWKKPRLTTSISTSSTAAYAAFTELWEKTIKQHDEYITQLQEQLWEQQEKSESLARAYNEETRAARRRIAEIEAENAALKEKVGLTRMAMESLKVLMEL